VKLSPKLLKQTDSYGGFLLFISFWRPNPSDPDPEMPGLKQQMISFLPVKPDQPCLCGSGQDYQDCCRPKRDWQPICHNPGAEGYSFLAPQEALFETVDAPTLKQRLDDDPRLAIVEDTPGGGFWIMWGDPALEDPQLGIFCFGDLELKPDGSLLVTAMSDLRMQTLLDLLQEIAAACLNLPKISQDPPPRLRKPPLKPRRQKRRQSSRRK
jgi:hypothetical protein